jgi:hypothetical protein
VCQQKIRNPKPIIMMQELFRFALSMLMLLIMIGTCKRAFAATWPLMAVMAFR